MDVTQGSAAGHTAGGDPAGREAAREDTGGGHTVGGDTDGGSRTEALVMADRPVAVRPCSVAAALEILGERWSLLAVREMFYGVHRFSRIAGFTGASRDILADRLRKLQDAGVVERHLYSEHPPRHEYHLTRAGRELFPVLLALRDWGDKWAVDAPAVVLHHSCGRPVQLDLRCGHCAGPVTQDSLTPVRPR